MLERFPGVVLNLDIKRTAPEVAPYEELLARLLAEFGRTRRRDRGLVPRPRHPSVPALQPVDAHLGGAPWRRRSSVRRVQAGEELPGLAAVALPGPRALGRPASWSTSGFVEAAHAAGMAVHVWTVNDEPTPWSA